MNYLFHPQAEKELLDAIDYYESCQKGLGHEFAVEIYAALERIVKYPEIWPPFGDDIRRSSVNRFP